MRMFPVEPYYSFKTKLEKQKTKNKNISFFHRRFPQSFVKHILIVILYKFECTLYWWLLYAFSAHPSAAVQTPNVGNNAKTHNSTVVQPCRADDGALEPPFWASRAVSSVVVSELFVDPGFTSSLTATRLLLLNQFSLSSISAR